MFNCIIVRGLLKSEEAVDSDGGATLVCNCCIREEEEKEGSEKNRCTNGADAHRICPVN